MLKHSLTSENYFGAEAQKKYMGSSSFKAWDNFHAPTEAFGNLVGGGCEARELAKMKGEWSEEDKKAFLIGHYVHSWSEGKEAFQEFCDKNHDALFTKKQELRADFQRAELMVQTLKNDPKVMQFLNDDTAKKEQIFVGQIAGVDFKIMVDVLNLEKGYFADIKTSADINKAYWKNGEKGTFIDAFDYRLQIALYSEILRQNLGQPEGEYLDCYIIAVDKKIQPDHEVIYMGKDFIAEKLIEIEAKLPRIMAVRNGEEKAIGCGKCNYCKSIKKIDRPISLEEFTERVVG